MHAMPVLRRHHGEGLRCKCKSAVPLFEGGLQVAWRCTGCGVQMRLEAAGVRRRYRGRTADQIAAINRGRKRP